MQIHRQTTITTVDYYSSCGSSYIKLGLSFSRSDPFDFDVVEPNNLRALIFRMNPAISVYDS